MKYFEVNYLSKGKKLKNILKAPNKNDAIAIAKIKIPGMRKPKLTPKPKLLLK